MVLYNLTEIILLIFVGYIIHKSLIICQITLWKCLNFSKRWQRDTISFSMMIILLWLSPNVTIYRAIWLKSRIFFAHTLNSTKMSRVLYIKLCGWTTVSTVRAKENAICRHTKWRFLSQSNSSNHNKCTLNFDSHRNIIVKHLGGKFGTFHSTLPPATKCFVLALLPTIKRSFSIL